MSDPAQPTQYPGFEISAEGLKQMHAALGLYLHQSLEKDLQLKRQAAQHQQQTETLVAQLEAQQADAPADDLVGPVPIKAPRGAARGG